MKYFVIFFILVCGLTAKAYPETGESYWIENYTRRVENFPIEGINFLCYPDLLQTPEAFHNLIEELAKRYKDYDISKIVGLEARGFLFGVALAYEMKKPFVMMRKKGKLPRKTQSVSYGLEYGTDVFEIEEESIDPYDQVLIVDDLLATGGTATAAVELIERLGAQVTEIACIYELENLKGREQVPAPVFSMLTVEE